MVGSRADARDATPVDSLGARSAGGLGAERDQPACKEKARSTSTRCKNDRGCASPGGVRRKAFAPGVRHAYVATGVVAGAQDLSSRHVWQRGRAAGATEGPADRTRVGGRCIRAPCKSAIARGYCTLKRHRHHRLFAHTGPPTRLARLVTTVASLSRLSTPHKPSSFHQTRTQPRHPHARVCRCVHGRAIAPTATCAMCG